MLSILFLRVSGDQEANSIQIQPKVIENTTVIDATYYDVG